jgi:hypothetical protein
MACSASGKVLLSLISAATSFLTWTLRRTKLGSSLNGKRFFQEIILRHAFVVFSHVDHKHSNATQLFEFSGFDKATLKIVACT